MTAEYIDKCQTLCIQMRSVLNAGCVLTEDEVMWYNAALAYLKQVNRMLEVNMRLSLDEEERKRNDEDDGAGSTSPVPSPPT